MTWTLYFTEYVGVRKIKLFCVQLLATQQSLLDVSCFCVLELVQDVAGQCQQHCDTVG
jgi:hypothetical protein